MYWVICALTFTFLIGAVPGDSYARDKHPAGSSGQMSYGNNEVCSNSNTYRATTIPAVLFENNEVRSSFDGYPPGTPVK